MKKRAINALLEMGMPADIKGFHYIVDAMTLFEKEEWRKGKITALYAEIARKNKTNFSSVERAIRHAFFVIITKGELKIVEKYLTLHHPTNGNLLQTFYIRLTQEE